MAYLPNPQANVQTSVPSSGNTITINLGVECFVAVPAGTLASLVFNLPGTPPDGTRVIIASTQTITSVSVTGNSGDAINSPPTTFGGGAATYATMIYIKANATWYRVG